MFEVFKFLLRVYYTSTGETCQGPDLWYRLRSDTRELLFWGILRRSNHYNLSLTWEVSGSRSQIDSFTKQDRECWGRTLGSPALSALVYIYIMAAVTQPCFTFISLSKNNLIFWEIYPQALVFMFIYITAL